MASSSFQTALLNSLQRDLPNAEEYSENYLAAAAELLAEYSESTPKKARSLAYNLPRNSQLRHDFLSGALPPSELCAMDAADLANDEVKSARAAIAERAEAKRKSVGSEATSLTRSVRCPECGCKEARFSHSGADARDWHGRKNEVWGSKHDEDEGPQVTITCTACEHSWQGDVPEIALDDEPPAVQRRGILGWKGSLRE